MNLYVNMELFFIPVPIKLLGLRTYPVYDCETKSSLFRIGTANIWELLASSLLLVPKTELEFVVDIATSVNELFTEIYVALVASSNL